MKLTRKPKASEKTTKTVAGCSPTRVQIRESAFRDRLSEDVSMVGVCETRTDTASARTSTGRIHNGSGDLKQLKNTNCSNQMQAQRHHGLPRSVARPHAWRVSISRRQNSAN